MRAFFFGKNHRPYSADTILGMPQVIALFIFILHSREIEFKAYLKSDVMEKTQIAFFLCQVGIRALPNVTNLFPTVL